MISNKDLLELSYNYVDIMSKSKKNNPQAIAIRNLLEKIDKEKVLKYLNLETQEFCQRFDHNIARDFIYKSDYFTPRSMYLINPLFYIKYTHIVFSLVYEYLNLDRSLNINDEQIRIFYSGRLEFDFSISKIKINAIFNNSYSEFQSERKTHYGNSVLKIDLENFFGSIKTKRLLEKLRNSLGHNKRIDDLEYMLNFCEFETLPQLHYSIASSILSQIYLTEFDEKMRKILDRNNSKMIRFVDDMFIILPSPTIDNKMINSLLNEISFYLWEDELALNTKKTEYLSPSDYKVYTEIALNDYEEDYRSFKTEKIIDEKVKKLVDNNLLIEYIEGLCGIENKYGIDLIKYHVLSKQYLATENGDVNKVVNHLMFSGKWKKLSDEDLLKIVDNWKYVLFNPTQFTIFYVIVCRYLENKKVIDGNKIKALLRYLFSNSSFNYRDTLVAISYLFQNKNKHKDLVSKIKNINPNYVKFIEKYI